MARHKAVARCGLALAASVALVWAGAAMAALAPARSPFDVPAKAGGPASEQEQQKVAEIRAAFEAGKYADAVEAAKAFLIEVKDPGARADATHLMADALRKKGEWRQAWSVYQKLRDLQTAGSDWYIKFDAVAEVVRASPTGVYAAVKDNPDGKTLADETALVAAVNKLGETRAAKVRTQAAGILRAKTPQDVSTMLQAALEGYRQARVITPNLPTTGEEEAMVLAGRRLGELAKSTFAVLTTKKAALDRAVATKRLNTQDRSDARQGKATCDDAIGVEDLFAKILQKAPQSKDWKDADAVKTDSEERVKQYKDLAKAYAAVAEAGGSGTDWTDWRQPPQSTKPGK